MVSETTANGSRERTQRTVALDQSALLEVLDALKTSGRPGAVRRRHRGVSAWVSTRKVDDLVRALGADSGISKSDVSAFRDRSLAGQVFPYVVDATYGKARVNRRVVAQAVVVATGVCGDGRRQVLGFAVGDSEDGALWTALLRSLKARGLGGVQLVIADAHLGLRQAIQATMAGAGVQRCPVATPGLSEAVLGSRAGQPRQEGKQCPSRTSTASTT
jgi:putative transposase